VPGGPTTADAPRKRPRRKVCRAEGHRQGSRIYRPRYHLPMPTTTVPCTPGLAGVRRPTSAGAPQGPTEGCHVNGGCGEAWTFGSRDLHMCGVYGSCNTSNSNNCLLCLESRKDCRCWEQSEISPTPCDRANGVISPLQCYGACNWVMTAPGRERTGGPCGSLTPGDRAPKRPVFNLTGLRRRGVAAG
jgi:hypothetical protein